MFGKKFFLLIVASLLVSFSSVAQIKYGIKAGVNAASLTNTSNASYRIAPLFGGFVEFGGKPVAAHLEVLFSSQGAKLADGQIELKLNYINFPLLMKYRIDAEGKAAIHAGPQVGLLLNATDHDGNDISERFEDAVIDLCFGLDYEIAEKVQLSLRYNMGLVRVPTNIDDDKVKNAVWQFSVGYIF